MGALELDASGSAAIGGLALGGAAGAGVLPGAGGSLGSVASSLGSGSAAEACRLNESAQTSNATTLHQRARIRKVRRTSS